MTLEQARPMLEAACNVPFRQLFAGHPEDLRTNKGNVGQLLLRYLGLPLDSKQLDFTDGELKTNKAGPDGMPRETMFISQISKSFPTLVTTPPTSFEQSYLHQKIRNLIYLPIVKDSPNVSDWYFVRAIHIRSEQGTKLYHILKLEYESICNGIVNQIEAGNDGMIHTTSGPASYLQIRTKDSKPYNPIYSPRHRRMISNKNFAWYFMKDFMIDAVNGRLS